MKILYTLLLLTLASSASTQTQFEGRIKYTVTTYEKDSNGELVIYFGKPGIRLEVKESKRPDKEQEIIILNFDSSSVITLTPGKTYQTSELRKKVPIPLPAKKEIAGFQTTPVLLDGMPKDLGGLFGSSILYPSDELIYHVPEVFSSNPQLIMISKGKIVLGGDFFVPSYPTGDWPTKTTNDSAALQQKLFSVIASEVVRQPLDPSLFVAPADYTKKSSNYYTDSTMVDTATVYFDSAVTYPVKPIPKKTKKPLKKTKEKTKQNATRRKND